MSNAKGIVKDLAHKVALEKIFARDYDASIKEFFIENSIDAKAAKINLFSPSDGKCHLLQAVIK